MSALDAFEVPAGVDPVSYYKGAVRALMLTRRAQMALPRRYWSPEMHQVAIDLERAASERLYIASTGGRHDD